MSVRGVADETAGAGIVVAVRAFTGYGAVFHGAVGNPGAAVEGRAGQSASCAAISAALDVNAFQVEIHDGVRNGGYGTRIGNVAEKAGVVRQAVFFGLNGFVHIQTGDGVALPVKVTLESVE